MLATIADPMIENTMLSGINDAMTNLRYGTKAAFSTAAVNAGVNLASQFVPTAFGQVARAVDDTRRNTYTDATGGWEIVGRGVNRMENKIPFLSKTNQPYVDAWGRTQKNTGGNFAGRLLYNMLSPGYYSEDKTTPVDTELERLYSATGDSAVLPGQAASKYTEDGESKKMTPAQYTQYATTRGQTSYNLIESLQQNPAYESLDDAQKADAVGQIYTLASNVAKMDTVNVPPASTQQKLYGIYTDGGEDAVIEYLMAKEGTEGTGKDGNVTNADYYSQIFGGYEGNEADLKNYLALASGTDKLQKVYDEKGTDVALEYLHMEQGANADGDGGLKKQEVIDWLNSSNLSNLQ